MHVKWKMQHWRPVKCGAVSAWYRISAVPQFGFLVWTDFLFHDMLNVFSEWQVWTAEDSLAPKLQNVVWDSLAEINKAVPKNVITCKTAHVAPKPVNVVLHQWCLSGRTCYLIHALANIYLLVFELYAHNKPGGSYTLWPRGHGGHYLKKNV